MSHLLDSNLVILHLNGELRTGQLVKTVASAGIAISLITYMEVYQGIFSSADPTAARTQFEVWLTSGVPVLHFDQAVALRAARLRVDLGGSIPQRSADRTVALRAARLRVDLAKQGRRVRSRALDLIIAATALEHGLTLVTWNKADFQDIPNLNLY